MQVPEMQSSRLPVGSKYAQINLKKKCILRLRDCKWPCGNKNGTTCPKTLRALGCGKPWNEPSWDSWQHMETSNSAVAAQGQPIQKPWLRSGQKSKPQAAAKLLASVILAWEAQQPMLEARSVETGGQYIKILLPIIIVVILAVSINHHLSTFAAIGLHQSRKEL